MRQTATAIDSVTQSDWIHHFGSTINSNAGGKKVPTLNSGFNNAGDMIKPGSFYFGFVLLRLNNKIRFVTNPKQFHLV